MSAISYMLMAETALYGLLAYVAVASAVAERQGGHDRLYRHHCVAAAAYSVIGIMHMIH